MAIAIQVDPSSLRVDEYGVIRVGDSQVILDLVIQEFNNGAEPEAIAHGYPTLHLADVYGADATVIFAEMRPFRLMSVIWTTLARQSIPSWTANDIAGHQPARANCAVVVASFL